MEVGASSEAPYLSPDPPAPEPSSEPLPEPEPPAVESPSRDARYPRSVPYCTICTLPAEIHEYSSKSQFEKCKVWLRRHAPHYFPDVFPAEYAARLEALKLAEETGAELPALDADAEEEEVAKVAKPVEQKTSGGKKKKTPAEIMLALGQRKGKKQVTIVYGLDLFGIKLKEAAKAAKRKFATGSSITTVSFCLMVMGVCFF